MQYTIVALFALLWLTPPDLDSAPRIGSVELAGSRTARIEQRAVTSDKAKRASDAEIRKRIIAESIESYPGNCACPYQSASNGSRCVRRSAYDREGGYGPLCYPRDVTDAMVAEYRARRASE